MSVDNTEQFEKLFNKMSANNTEQLEKLFNKYSDESIKVARCKSYLDAIMWTAGRFPNKQEDNSESKDRMHGYLMQKYDQCIEKIRS
jgi:hypothetical protein